MQRKAYDAVSRHEFKFTFYLFSIFLLIGVEYSDIIFSKDHRKNKKQSKYQLRIITINCIYF